MKIENHPKTDSDNYLQKVQIGWQNWIALGDTYILGDPLVKTNSQLPTGDPFAKESTNRKK